ncbi:MAG: cytidine deaminase [Lachnospiraceae bacterium]|nr:cytidine deaminase [Lachnospiraceae bacterium]
MEERARDRELIQAAIEARERAYAPYSDYLVGAALLTGSGEIYQGCNIENASYGATNCAERTAFFKAVSQGKREFRAIAIVGGKRKSQQGDVFPDIAYPCGICRQVMREFCGPEFRILVGKSAEDYEEYTLKEILPESFGPKWN